MGRRRKDAYLSALLRDNPEYHLALLKLSEGPKPKKVRPPNPKWELMLRYRLRPGAKQCRQGHAAYVWRRRSPKAAGGIDHCGKCLYRRVSKIARLEARKAKALQEGRVV